MTFELKKLRKYKENNRLEVKKAMNGLPTSIWETYSAFANCYGGVIILGISENKDGTWITTGLNDVDKLLKDFWNQIHSDKVSVNLLTEKDVEVIEHEENVIIVIHVHRALREQRPVYINGDILNGTYRRDHDGDYHCTKEEVRAMLRDEPNNTMDMKIIEYMGINDLNKETINAYRNVYGVFHPDHVWTKLKDEDFLELIGALQRSSKDNQLHVTGAGLLMFGNEYKIVQEYHEYFLDYREIVSLDPRVRWTDRIQSMSGDWSGNLFDFYYAVSNKLTRDLKVPFKLEGMNRIDDTPVHKAVREALVNCLVNTDFYIQRGVVILKDRDKIIFQNPGSIRPGKLQMKKGGLSDPRNSAIMKMFTMIAIGERAGSGVPSNFGVWKDQGWKAPKIEEQYGPDRTILTLEFTNRKAQISANDTVNKIYEYLELNDESDVHSIASYVNLSAPRTRAILSTMKDIEVNGNKKYRKYKIASDKASVKASDKTKTSGKKQAVKNRDIMLKNEEFPKERTKKMSNRASDKTSDKTKTSGKKQAVKTIENIAKIKEFLQHNGESNIKDISMQVGLSVQRTRALLQTIEDVEGIGSDKTRKYRLK